MIADSKNVTGTPHEGTFVTLQVHYQGENQVSGLFILVQSQPTPDDAPYASTASQESTVRNIAQLLWNELLEAQSP